MYFRLNDDLPGLEAGAVVDADVAAEGLPQIDRPEGLGEDEEAGEREGVSGVAEEEAVAEGKIAGDGGGGGVGRVEEAVEEFGGGGGVGGGEGILREEDVAGVEPEERGRVGLEGGAGQPHHAERQRVVLLRRRLVRRRGRRLRAGVGRRHHLRRRERSGCDFVSTF